MAVVSVEVRDGGQEERVRVLNRLAFDSLIAVDPTSFERRAALYSRAANGVCCRRSDLVERPPDCSSAVERVRVLEIGVMT